MATKLSIVEFGKQLIDTGDLDPVYIAIHKSGLSSGDKVEFVLSWLMYYHCGLACWTLAQSRPVLDTLMLIAKASSGFPRGSQRVHHRGQVAVDSANDLLQSIKVARSFLPWTLQEGQTGRAVFYRICELVGWGPCMAWRVPDLWERLGLANTLLTDGDTDLFFSNPRRGAILCCEEYGLDTSNPCLSAHKYLMEHLGHLLAPPRYERTIGVQETETVFCKWKSHMVGRYKVGRDTARARQQFLRYGRQRLSQLLVKGLPKIGEV